LQTDNTQKTPIANAKLLRVVFLGMDLQILDALRRNPIHLIGAYLPTAPYGYHENPPFFLKIIPRFLMKKRLRTAAVYSSLARFLSQSGISALNARSVNNSAFQQMLIKNNPDLGIIANFGQIIGPRLLRIPRYGFINYHPSLLPKYRGPTPLGHILLHGEKISGITWHKVTEKPDQGGILAQAQFDIHSHETVKSLENKAVTTAIELLGPMLQRIAQEGARPQPQDDASATYFPKLTKKEKKLLSEMEQRHT
jgi:methionyl-tRNA formyltransferase